MSPPYFSPLPLLSSAIFDAYYLFDASAMALRRPPLFRRYAALLYFLSMFSPLILPFFMLADACHAFHATRT